MKKIFQSFGFLFIGAVLVGSAGSDREAPTFDSSFVQSVFQIMPHKEYAMKQSFAAMAHERAGDLYSKAGDSWSAKDEYRKAALIWKEMASQF